MRTFQFDFLKVIPKEISFFGERYVEKFPVLRISGGSNSHQNDTPIRYSRVILNVVWPITLQFHVDVTDYLAGSSLERHVDLDSSKPGEEYRLVVVLKKAVRGGELLCDKFILNTKRVKLFSTRIKHEVTKIEEGKRRVLLLGIYFSPASPIGR